MADLVKDFQTELIEVGPVINAFKTGFDKLNLTAHLLK